MPVFDVCPVCVWARILPGFLIVFIVIVSLPQYPKPYLQYMRENAGFHWKWDLNENRDFKEIHKTNPSLFPTLSLSLCVSQVDVRE